MLRSFTAVRVKALVSLVSMNTILHASLFITVRTSTVFAYYYNIAAVFLQQSTAVCYETNSKHNRVEVHRHTQCHCGRETQDGNIG
jgi:ABC-type arginine transport system permease subunit